MAIILTVFAQLIFKWLNGSLDTNELMLARFAALNDVSINQSRNSASLNPWFSWINVIGLYFILLFILEIFKAKKPVIIQDFANYTKEQPDSTVRGLNTLLYNELDRISLIFSNVNEKRPISTTIPETSNEFKQAMIIGGVGDEIQNIINADSELDLGIFKIPIGTVMSLIGRIAQGPRIAGSLQDGDHGGQILTAQLIGVKSSNAWSVGELKSALEPSNRTLDDLLQELAYRMFTTLYFRGTVHWRATWKFCEGLEAYRECLRTPRIRNKKLEEAETRFIEAVAEDEKLDLAYHNLGVIYTELGNYQDNAQQYEEAAISAFERAVTENPRRWESHYALALHSFENKRFEEAINRCDHILNHKAEIFDLAPIYNLKGLAIKKLDPNDINCLRESIKAFNKAANMSLLDLLKSEFNGIDIEEKEESGCRFLSNLANSYLALSENDSSMMNSLLLFVAKLISSKAVSLAKDPYAHAYAHFLQGNTYFKQKNLKAAIEEFEHAARIDPKRYMHVLATECSRAQKICNNLSEKEEYKKKAMEACRKILNSTPSGKQGITRMRDLYVRSIDRISEDKDALCAVKNAYWRLEDKEDEDLTLDRIRHLMKISRIAKDVDKAVEGKNGDIEKSLAEIESLAKRCEDAINEKKSDITLATGSKDEMLWEYVETNYVLGILYMYKNEIKKYKEAEKCFQNVLNMLKSNKKNERIKQLSLNAWLASALFNQEKLEDAWKHAVKAHRENPLDFFGHMVLGQVYLCTHNMDMAKKEWNDALIWALEVGDPHIIAYLGFYSLKEALSYKKQDQRVPKIQSSIKHLERALALYDSLDAKAWAHYWIGKSQLCLGDLDAAVINLKIAETVFSTQPQSDIFEKGWTWHIVALDLANTYLEQRSYDKCEELFLHVTNKTMIKIAKESEKYKIEEGWVPSPSWFWGFSTTYHHENSQSTQCYCKVRYIYEMNLKNIAEDLEGPYLHETKCLSDILLAANLGLANSHVERDGDLEKAYSLAEDAENLINLLLLMDYFNQANCPDKPELMAGFVIHKAECAYLKGRILSKRRNMDKALVYHTNAVSLTANSKYYLHLALTYEQKIYESRDTNMQKQNIDLAKNCIIHAEELDIDKKHSKSLKEAKHRLNKIWHTRISEVNTIPGDNEISNAS